LAKQDVNVTLNNGVLTIAGERKEEKTKNTHRYHRVECSYGSFSRSFSLPGGADSDRINAEFKNGILVVRVGKAEAAKPKRIEVKTD
jgi:HSP20 family protein